MKLISLLDICGFLCFGAKALNLVGGQLESWSGLGRGVSTSAVGMEDTYMHWYNKESLSHLKCVLFKF